MFISWILLHLFQWNSCSSGRNCGEGKKWFEPSFFRVANFRAKKYSFFEKYSKKYRKISKIPWFIDIYQYILKISKHIIKYRYFWGSTYQISKYIIKYRYFFNDISDYFSEIFTDKILPKILKILENNIDNIDNNIGKYWFQKYRIPVFTVGIFGYFRYFIRYFSVFLSVFFWEWKIPTFWIFFSSIYRNILIIISIISINTDRYFPVFRYFRYFCRYFSVFLGVHLSSMYRFSMFFKFKCSIFRFFFSAFFLFFSKRCYN